MQEGRELLVVDLKGLPLNISLVHLRVDLHLGIEHYLHANLCERAFEEWTATFDRGLHGLCISQGRKICTYVILCIPDPDPSAKTTGRFAQENSTGSVHTRKSAQLAGFRLII